MNIQSVNSSILGPKVIPQGHPGPVTLTSVFQSLLSTCDVMKMLFGPVVSTHFSEELYTHYFRDTLYDPTCTTPNTMSCWNISRKRLSWCHADSTVRCPDSYPTTVLSMSAFVCVWQQPVLTREPRPL